MSQIRGCLYAWPYMVIVGRLSVGWRMQVRGEFKISHSRIKKYAGKHWEHVCDMYATSHRRPFVPSAGDIGLQCNV